MINVIGSGSWGISFSSYLHRIGFDVTVYHRNSTNSKKIIHSCVHPSLNGSKISKDIIFTNQIERIDFNNITVFALPSKALSYFSEFKYSEKSKFILFKWPMYVLSKGSKLSVPENKKINIDLCVKSLAH